MTQWVFSPWQGLSNLVHKGDNHFFVRVGVWAELSCYFSCHHIWKRSATPLFPTRPSFMPKGYQWRRWREWLSRICCRSLFFLLLLLQSHVHFRVWWDVVRTVSCVRHEDGGGRRGERVNTDRASKHLVIWQLPLSFTADGLLRLISLFFFFFSLPILSSSENHSVLNTNSGIPLCNHFCLFCPVGNGCLIHKSW